jgi:hypothetical protein
VLALFFVHLNFKSSLLDFTYFGKIGANHNFARIHASFHWIWETNGILLFDTVFTKRFILDFKVDLAHRSGDRQNDLKNERRRAQMEG